MEGGGLTQWRVGVSHSGGWGSYLAAGPALCAAVPKVGRRGRRWRRARCAWEAALPPCRMTPAPPGAVKTPPMSRPTPGVAPPPPTAVEVETEVAPPAGGLEAGPLEAGPMGAGPGVHWADAGPDGHACWHSARVRKLLLLPWQFPYQKWTHLPAMTS